MKHRWQQIVLLVGVAGFAACGAVGVNAETRARDALRTDDPKLRVFPSEHASAPATTSPQIATAAQLKLDPQNPELDGYRRVGSAEIDIPELWEKNGATPEQRLAAALQELGAELVVIDRKPRVDREVPVLDRTQTVGRRIPTANPDIRNQPQSASERTFTVGFQPYVAHGFVRASD